MSTQQLDRSHPVTEFARPAQRGSTSSPTSPPGPCAPKNNADALADLAKVETQITTMRLKVLGEAERSGATAAQAAATAADWVAVETRQTRIAARSDLNLTHALDQHQRPRCSPR